MFKLASAFAAAALALAIHAAPALAQSPVTFVSGKGTDAGSCAAPATPCRTFQYALGLTNAGGEIKALDPANYFFVTINKSINITGVDGAGIIRGTAGNAVTINAGAGGVVSLSNLTIDGVNRTATNGILLNSAALLTIRNCTTRNFLFRGILLFPTTALSFLIADTVATNNQFAVHVFPQGAGSATGVLDHVVASRSDTGISIQTSGGGVGVTAVDSVASNNVTGFFVGSGTTLHLNHSTATSNSFGISVNGTARSAGNNFINGNTTNVSGTLSNDGTL